MGVTIETGAGALGWLTESLVLGKENQQGVRRDVGGSSIAAVVNTRDKSFGNHHESIKSSGDLGSEGPPNVRDVPRLSDG